MPAAGRKIVMPTVATQTVWSWLQDWKDIEDLVSKHKVDWKELSVSFGAQNESIQSKETSTIILPSIEKQDSSTSHEAITSIEEDSKTQTTTDTTNEFILPPIASKPCSNAAPAEESETEASSLADRSLPPIFQQLDEISLSGHESNEESTTDGSDNDDSNDSTEESIETDVIERQVEKYSKLRSAGKQPGLTILQYITESESMFYKYFCMKNKDKVEKRITDTREKSPRGQDVTKQADHKIMCQFCGKPVKEISLLEIIQKQKDGIEDREDVFCCEAYTEYMVLVGMCMRRKVEEAKSLPKKRPPKLKKKLDKKALHERALAIARKKQKWEEMQERRRLEAEALRMKRKGLETIKFTLLDSETVVEKGWAVKPASRLEENKDTAKLKRKESKLKKEKEEEAVPKEYFSPRTLERIESLTQTSGILTLSSSTSFLPDGTGFCRYPSGNLAVVVASPYTGVLSYMVYNDLQNSQLLCFFDELGRACCHYQDGSIQFVSSQNFAAEYNYVGKTERIVTRGEDPETPEIYYKTKSFKLNKHMLLKCSPGLSRLTVNFPHNQMKFIAASKLAKDEAPVYVSALHNQTTRLQSELSAIKSKVEEVKQHLRSTRSRVGRLLPLHGSPIRRRSRQISHVDPRI